MNITTKYNVNDKIVFRDGNTKISAIIQKILVCAASSYLEIKYITDYGMVYQDEVIDNNESNGTNNKTANSIQLVAMTSGLFNKPLKSKYNIGQLVEYSYRKVTYVSIIKSINIKDETIIYKLEHDDKDFLEKEIKAIEFNIHDEIIYSICCENDKIEYYKGIIVTIYSDCIMVKNNDYLICVEYNQILRRI